MVEISIVIPVFDERESIEALCRETLEVFAAHEVELIIVDDGSRDGSWEVISKLTAGEPRIAAIRLRRNFGKAAALSAGFKRARGAIVCTLDGDGQDDPRELLRCREELERGFDLVSGWKRERRDPWHKTIPSRIFNLLAGLRLKDQNSGLKCMRADVVRELRIYGELHRFIPSLAHARGFRITEIPVHHRPRRFGRSKYGSERFLRGFLDLAMVRLLTDWGGRPQHVLGGVGLACFSAGAIAMAYLAGTWIYRFAEPEGYLSIVRRPLTVYALAALIFGAQMMSLGFLAGLLPLYRASDAELYSVAEVIDPDNARS